MPKLHLVGITPDHRGLVLSEHARAKRGDMVLEIDDRLIEAIDKAQRLRTFEEGHRLESNALPTRTLVNGDGDVATRLTPREIQQRLRAGESVAALARSSGTDEAWIRRFAAPVLAEQAKVIERARSVTFTKRGVGLSGVSLGPAVAANVLDRGAPLTLPDLEAGWGAHQHPEGGWRVTFTFPLRGRRQTAEWEIELATGELTARNKLASDLGWREPGKRLPRPKPVKAPAAKRAPTGKAEPAAPSEPATPSEDATLPAAADVEPGDAPSGDAPQDKAIQVLPLDEDAPDPDATQVLPPGGLVRKVSLPRRPPPSKPGKAPASKPRATKAPSAGEAAATEPAPASKRAAVASTETAAQTVVPVPSMPPTDLDVVDMVVDLREEEAVREPAPLGSPPAPPGGPPAP